MTQEKVSYKKFFSVRKFGVELEVNNNIPKSRIKTIIDSVSDRGAVVLEWAQSRNNRVWHVKEDASCGPAGLDGPMGFEIASYVGSGIDDIIHISSVADYLKQKKVEVTDYCGMHIHADASDLTIKQVGTIVAYWLKIERILSMALPLRRRNNEFCRYLQNRSKWMTKRDRQYPAEEIWDIYKPEDLTEGDNVDRRCNLNLVNYARGVWYKWIERKTLELRCPEGTLDNQEVKNWIRLYLHFIETVKDIESPKDTLHADLSETLSILGLHHSNQEFSILSEGLMETKTWFLSRIVKHLKNDGMLSLPLDKLIMGKHVNEIERKDITNQALVILNQMWNPLKVF